MPLLSLAQERSLNRKNKRKLTASGRKKEQKDSKYILIFTNKTGCSCPHELSKSYVMTRTKIITSSDTINIRKKQGEIMHTHIHTEEDAKTDIG